MENVAPAVHITLGSMILQDAIGGFIGSFFFIFNLVMFQLLMQGIRYYKTRNQTPYDNKQNRQSSASNLHS